PPRSIWSPNLRPTTAPRPWSRLEVEDLPCPSVGPKRIWHPNWQKTRPLPTATAQLPAVPLPTTHPAVRNGWHAYAETCPPSTRGTGADDVKAISILRSPTRSSNSDECSRKFRAWQWKRRGHEGH